MCSIIKMITTWDTLLLHSQFFRISSAWWKLKSADFQPGRRGKSDQHINVAVKTENHWILVQFEICACEWNEWMNRMEMKLRMEGGKKKSLSEERKVAPLLHIPHVFVFRLCFTLNYGFIQTYIHSWWTMNFSFFPPPSSLSHFEDECRDWMCVVCFSKISPRGFHISYSK